MDPIALRAPAAIPGRGRTEATVAKLHAVDFGAALAPGTALPLVVGAAAARTRAIVAFLDVNRTDAATPVVTADAQVSIVAARRTAAPVPRIAEVGLIAANAADSNAVRIMVRAAASGVTVSPIDVVVPEDAMALIVAQAPVSGVAAMRVSAVGSTAAPRTIAVSEVLAAIRIVSSRVGAMTARRIGDAVAKARAVAGRPTVGPRAPKSQICPTTYRPPISRWWSGVIC
ncbi:hypothetical protein GCM10023318_40820 [Nocardia callitridis]|uniref:Uncharacterized protein n=1 Tax=Nocardia callitridis TaxID=648753 RepID=A0ABP9KJS6_9NOCA